MTVKWQYSSICRCFWFKRESLGKVDVLFYLVQSLHTCRQNIDEEAYESTISFSLTIFRYEKTSIVDTVLFVVCLVMPSTYMSINTIELFTIFSFRKQYIVEHRVSQRIVRAHYIFSLTRSYLIPWYLKPLRVGPQELCRVNFVVSNFP